MQKERWNIAIVENELNFLEAIQKQLKESNHFKEIHVYDSAEKILRESPSCLKTLSVALFDINLKDMNGIDLLSEVKAIYPELPVIMITNIASQEKILEALKQGASGYLWKSELVDLIPQIRIVMEGGAIMSPSIAVKVAEFFRKPLQENPDLLSNREKQILKMLSTGLSTQEVSDHLKITTETVRSHIKRIFEKLQVNSRIMMINKAIKMGFI